MHNPEFVLEKEMHKILLDFEIKKNASLCLGRTTRLCERQKKKKKKEKKSCLIVDFAAPVDHRIKQKGS